MKRYMTILLVAAIAVISAASCQKETLNSKSVIKIEKVTPTPFDAWLERNYVNPYNIEIKYRYELNETDKDYYTIPSDYELSIKMAHLLKYLCVDSYDENAGPAFTKSYFPKMFCFIGEFEYRNNGTMVLGTAEGGKKIILAGINYLDVLLDRGDAAIDDINELYIKTIHHEFTHILNQTKSFPTDFGQITGSGYVADSWSTEPYNVEYLKNGFITSYAQYADYEDFAEMVSTYITNSKEFWDAQLKAAGTEGAKNIQAKLDIVRNYLETSWGIDIDALRATIMRRQKDIFSGKVDLTDISID